MLTKRRYKNKPTNVRNLENWSVPPLISIQAVAAVLGGATKRKSTG